MPLTRVKGSSWDTLDNLVVSTIADLTLVEEEGIIFISGALRENDGNGGWFKFDPNELRSNADGDSIIDATGTSAGRGCWIRQRYRTEGPGMAFSEVQKATAGQTAFRLQHITYTPGEGSLAIYVNGTRLTPYSFTETSASTVSLGVPLRANDTVEFLHYENPTGGNVNITALQVSFDNLASGIGSTDVQGALLELEAALAIGGGGGGGGGGVPINALAIPYLAVAPDVSNNVQDGMHWIQKKTLDHIGDLHNAHIANSIGYSPNVSGLFAITVQDALDELAASTGSSTAIGTSFDNTSFPLNGDNVQDVLEEVIGAQGAHLQELDNHLHDPVAAHNALAISLASANPLFAAVSEVHTALEVIAESLDMRDFAASRIKYNDFSNGLGSYVQDALTELDKRAEHHIDDPLNAHLASAIKFAGTNGIVAGNVGSALDELNEKRKEHKVSQTAHNARHLVFSPLVPSAFVATDVEAAILEAASIGGQVFNGHTDLTFPYSPPTIPYNNNEYFVISDDGIPDASWHALFANILPQQVSRGDSMVFDGSKFWYTVKQVSADTPIVTAPAPGQGQSIQIADGLDIGLTILGAAGQTADVLELGGNLLVHGTVRDHLGDVRQKAEDVSYDPNQSSLVAITVQAALNDLDLYRNIHVLGHSAPTRHAANTINFLPVLGITSLDVQGAIRDVQHNLLEHVTVPGAHMARRISFDNSGTALTSTNVQDAILETVTASGGNHINNPVDAHAASAISFDNTLTGVTADTVQDVLDELILTQAFDVINGGIF